MRTIPSVGYEQRQVPRATPGMATVPPAASTYARTPTPEATAFGCGASSRRSRESKRAPGRPPPHALERRGASRDNRSAPSRCAPPPPVQRPPIPQRLVRTAPGSSRRTRSRRSGNTQGCAAAVAEFRAARHGAAPPAPHRRRHRRRRRYGRTAGNVAPAMVAPATECATPSRARRSRQCEWRPSGGGRSAPGAPSAGTAVAR